MSKTNDVKTFFHFVFKWFDLLYFYSSMYLVFLSKQEDCIS